MVTFDLGVYERLCWEILSGHHAAKRDCKRAKGDRGCLGQGESPRVVRCSIWRMRTKLMAAAMACAC